MKIMTITNNLKINFKQLQKYCFISRPQNIPPNRKKTRSRSRRKQMHLKQVQQLIPGRVIPIICTGTRPAAAWRVFVWHPVLCKTGHLPYASGSTRCTGCKKGNLAVVGRSNYHAFPLNRLKVWWRRTVENSFVQSNYALFRRKKKRRSTIAKRFNCTGTI